MIDMCDLGERPTRQRPETVDRIADRHQRAGFYFRWKAEKHLDLSFTAQVVRGDNGAETERGTGSVILVGNTVA